MPPPKKRRSRTTTDEGDVVGPAPAATTNDTSRTLRKRKSNEPEKPTDSPETDVDVDEDDFVPEGRLPPPSKRTRSSLTNIVPLPDTEPLPPLSPPSSQIPRGFDKLRKVVRKQGRAASDGGKSCSGIVKSIRMFNFMCHAGFSQEWHPNLNFVTGENGSGKSALLTALLMGLGAKASLTSRTKSMTSLIQKGKDHARTEITLMNNGSLPLAKYGPEIMIERTISRSGTSTYRLKGIGKIRKMKKHELEYILLAFNIQLDNPVAILNQEVAKNFLRTKDPKDKYQLFYQGTLLSKLFALLDDSKNSIAISEKNLNAQKTLLTKLRSEIRQIEAKLKEVDNLSSVRLKSKMLGREYLWAVANDEEKQMNELQKSLDGHQEAIGIMTEKLDASVEKKRNLQEEIQPGQDRTNEIRIKIREKEASLEETRKELTMAQKAVQKLNATIRINRDTARKKERTLNDLRVTLDKLKSNSEADKENAIREYTEQKQILTEEKARVQEELVSLKRDVAQSYQRAEAAKTETNAIEDEFKAYSNSYESKKRHLTTLQSSGTNKYAIFGRNMESLMTKINGNLRKFSKPPRGPIAAYLTVKDPKFAGVVEHVLKNHGFLTTFMVNNNEDLILLKRFIQEAYQGAPNSSQYGRQSMSGNLPSIKVNAFSDNVYELGHGAARVRGVPTLLDLLEVENNDPVVLNGLCDYVNAEQTLMFESNQAAAQILKDTSRFPSCTKYGYTLEWYRFLPAPSYAAQAQQTRETRARYLKSSKSAQIEGLRAEVEELQEKMNEMMPILNQRRKEDQDLRRAAERMNAQQEEKRRILTGIDRKLRENENKKYKEPDVASHEEEIMAVQEALERIAEENEEADKGIQDGNKKIEGLTNQKDELHFNIVKLQKNIDEGAAERHKKQLEIQKIEQLLERLKGKIKDLLKAKEPSAESLKKSEREFERKLKQAEESGEKIQSNRSAAEVKREVEAIKVKMAALEKHIGDSAKLKRDFDRMSKDLHGKIKEFGPMYQCFCLLKGVIESQITFLFRKRISITNGLTYMFTSLVEQRGYKGKMIINHQTQDLHFYICPDQSSSNRANEAMNENDRNAKKTLVEYSLGLSGGERSYSTICFIISLWQVMECPFYMLDEFDVFMDAFNRKASQQALIVHAKSQKTRQFFLFSPLDLVEIPARNEATVIRLKPARPDNENSFSGDNESENVDPSQNTRGARQQPQLGRQKTPSAQAPKGNTRSKANRSSVAVAMSEKNRVSARR